ncbi:MAG: hypothetical protein JJE16_00470 [Nitrospiraceae bacterium]|nr:hypothetical protein [Nitrospiraceae bacterium]
MKRIALDTNIVNRIAATTGLIEEICTVAKAGRIIIVGIPTVRNELEQTPDLDRRALLVGVYDQFPREDVLDQASVWDASKWGQSLWGDGSHTGVSVEATRTGNTHRGARDGIIAVTASGKADVLVTEDRELKRKVCESTAQCEVWTFEDLIHLVRETK